jgi:hypothetical protein
MRAGVPAAAWERHEAAARSVYQRGFTRMRENEPDAKAEAALLLQARRLDLPLFLRGSKCLFLRTPVCLFVYLRIMLERTS